MQRILVVHMMAKLELGGAQKVLLETAKRLDKRRFENVLISGDKGMLVEEAISLQGIRAYFLPEFVREIHPLKDLLALLKITNILSSELRRFLPAGSPRLPSTPFPSILRASGPKGRTGRSGQAGLLPPVIVHTHGSKAGVLGRVAARLAGIPIIVHTIHGFAFHDFQPKGVKSAIVLLERLCARLATVLIAVSEATREKGLRHRIGHRGQYAVVRPGAVLDEFLEAKVDSREKKVELGLDPDLPVVGTVSCFKPQKAPLDFVRVAARVSGSFPDVQFVAVGDGVLRGEVERLTGQLGLRGKVHLLGWRKDVSHIVPVFDVFLLTSLWEGLPIVFAEVMSRGIPAVATSVDGTPEAVIDGVTGFLAPPHEIEALAEKVLLLLRDGKRRRIMGILGGKLSRKFDIGRMVKEMEALYLTCVGEGPRTRGPPGGEE